MGAAEVEDDGKDSCSHRDASASGVGELRKTSNSGVHGSIFRRRLFVSVRTLATQQGGKLVELNARATRRGR